MGESEVIKIKKGFRSGYMQLRRCDFHEAKLEIAKALGITPQAVDAYKNGKREPKVTQAIEIEKVFKKYGVTENIWGTEHDTSN